jgi:hypothetical protein
MAGARMAEPNPETRLEFWAGPAGSGAVSGGCGFFPRHSFFADVRIIAASLRCLSRSASIPVTAVSGLCDTFFESFRMARLGC